jgi:hypothetical protein
VKQPTNNQSIPVNNYRKYDMTEKQEKQENNIRQRNVSPDYTMLV